MIPQPNEPPNNKEVREFYTLSDLLELKLADRAYILLYERINGQSGVIFHNTHKEEVVGFLREMADELSKSSEDDFSKIRTNEFQN
jgi:hypothetical protein